MGDSTQARAHVRRQIGEFLTTRRAGLHPAQAGLAPGRNRRVKGLRREEVAALAGISVEYYVRLERGQATGASDGVLEGVGRALRFGDDERAHLTDLLRSGSGVHPCRLLPSPSTVRPAVRRILDSMTATPALVLNGRLEIAGANDLGRALYGPLTGPPEKPVGWPESIALSTFSDPGARTFWRDWPAVATGVVNHLRAQAGRNPCDHVLTGLVDDLCSRSEVFRDLWARHEVRVPRAGLHRVRHPVAGDLDLPFESAPLDPGLTLLMYSAEPGTASDAALRRLASPPARRACRPEPAGRSRTAAPPAPGGTPRTPTPG
ncbi:helix-turn-helix domain-containing protein [Kineosporia sp. J2-2]|uniref:Helix-turn-helix domain-containing protein n=1 Tax=Kineosporia corallincola TaxID=2835133 RepID=A0ABS5TFI0_9ACTN|nr:helix-turn-helix transcriptional regulator [Kineosporia corallincola]MBT0769848.1 helix-turn-helix domain-containing protein [Kineosporia corallincola]